MSANGRSPRWSGRSSWLDRMLVALPAYTPADDKRRGGKRVAAGSNSHDTLASSDGLVFLGYPFNHCPRCAEATEGSYDHDAPNTMYTTWCKKPEVSVWCQRAKEQN
jgi:hypothetical protein